MKKIELLAPAGSMESLQAAVQNGADAVYLGGAKFSARAYASNFNEENMIKAVEYCHLYNIKMYVTVNTLMKEDEIKEALEYVKFLYEIGVDALIIQDVGLAKLIKKNLPDFELHASTQMTAHNGEGATFLKNLGFSRIVLSRELSLDEIKYISKNLNIETEIFIHGALCVSYSGQCLMSSLIGGRSGNRGRCAQPCRLPYEIINKDTGKSNKGYLLSPKDICTIKNIREIIKTGTSSLKIEGRMKRPEYVAGVVAAYRKAIDNAYCDLEVEEKKLLQLFNREGFSKAYLFGNEGRGMMSYRFPKNTGIPIGKVNRDLTINLKENISLQDGIRFGDDGFTIFKIVKDSKNVDEAFVGDIVKLKPTKYKPGDILYKTSDNKLLNSLSKTYEDIYGRKNSLKLVVDFRIDNEIELSINYEGKEYKATGDKVQKAINKPLDKGKLIKNLTKTGDTPFEFTNIEFINFEDGFMPLSSINAIRRELIEKILNDLKNQEKRKCNRELDFSLSNIKREVNKDNSYMIVVSTKEQLNAAFDTNVKNIAVELFMNKCDIDLKNIKCENLYIKTSTIIKEEFENVCSVIEKNLSNIEGIITSNLGIIKKFKGRTSIIGDYKLNIFNSYGIDFYNGILDEATISAELNKKEINNMIKNSSIPCNFIVYGRTELMISEYCPIGSVFGRKDSVESKCTGACMQGTFVLKDRMGEEMLIKTDKYCRSHIYNSVPTNLIPNLEEIKKLNINSLRLDFIDENYDETRRIIESFKEESFDLNGKKYTRGHFKRGVE